MNPYEIPRFDLEEDRKLTALWKEHVKNQICPECGSKEIELRPGRSFVEVVCVDCGWCKEIA